MSASLIFYHHLFSDFKNITFLDPLILFVSILIINI